MATLTIGGQDFSPWLARETLDHLDDLAANPDTLKFKLNALNGSARCPAAAAGAEVIYTLASSVRLFGGVLQSPVGGPQGFRAVQQDCSCTDYRTYLDRRRLNDRFTAMKPGAIAVALVKKYCPEVDTSLVDLTSGPTIASIRFRRTDTLTGALAKLAATTGMQWDLTPNKQLLFGVAGSIAAPFGLYDGGMLFEGLTVTIDRSQLANSVTVKGGVYPAATTTTDRFTGDGLTTAFRLSGVPFGLDVYNVFAEAWGSFNTATWAKADVANPAPPAGHVSSDGYLFTTIQQGAALAESGKLQVVGGDGTWGDSRVWGLMPLDRGRIQTSGVNAGLPDGNRRFEWDVYTEGGGSCRVGLWDPANTGALAGEQHGVLFDGATNQLKPSEGGTLKTPLATVNYTVAPGRCVRVRIMPKGNGTAGAVTWVNTDDSNGFRSSQWVKLYDSSAGALPQLTLVPVFDKDFIGRIGRLKVFNKLYGATLTVSSVEKVVGMLNVDNDGGVDALIGLAAGQTPQLAFFGDTTPASSAAVALTFNQAIPVLLTAQDGASIAAVKAIENPGGASTGSDGVYEGYVEDTAIDSLDLAFRRASEELATYANPLVTIEFTTYTAGLAAGQVLPVKLTVAGGSDRDLAGSFLVQRVETKSQGGDNYAFTVTAGSRLKGLHEYLLDLLMAGHPIDATGDDHGILDQSSSASDTLAFSEVASIAPGPVGPYWYADGFETEDGGLITGEDGACIITEESLSTALYGQSTYT